VGLDYAPAVKIFPEREKLYTRAQRTSASLESVILSAAKDPL